MTTIIFRHSLLALVFIAITGFIGGGLYALYKKPEPQFFPLDDKNATYTIVKSPVAANNNSQISTQDTSSDIYYFVKYTGEHIWPALEAKQSFAVLVGKSNVDLKQFVGRKVRITGEFVESSKQCIQADCVGFSGPWVVLDVGSVVSVQ